jgi:alanyl-tRNA synthetase
MNVREVRQKFLDFYTRNGHVILPSAPLVPENDPTTLFTGSGMQPLVPYLLGEVHPQGTRLANSQKAFRSVDIDDVGDNRHTTFFEMLGNWSLGDYFKQEQLPWVFSFLVDEVGIDPKKLYVTAFIGDEKNGVAKDTEVGEIWKKLFASKGIEATAVDIGSEERGAEVGMQGGRIFYYDAKKNWWSRSGVPEKMPAGEPGGPDSELFYEFDFIEHDTKYGAQCHPNCDCGRFLEIGNSVFMQFKKEAAGGFSKLPKQNVDFGGGLERICAVSENSADVFTIDVFKELLTSLETLSGKKYHDPLYIRSFRIVADHIRSAIFLIGDGVLPSNSDQGYFVRRLIRRAVAYADKLGIGEAGLAELVVPLLAHYEEAYPATYTQREFIKAEIKAEELKFREALKQGLREFAKITGEQISGKDAFALFSSFGFPVEMTVELAREQKRTVDVAGFEQEMKKHQDLSRSGSEKKFKGGLADEGEQTVRYHTATHLLHQALREVLGTHVGQKGSNITPERLRFDFSHTAKLTDEEKKRVEEIVNAQIRKSLPVKRVELPKVEAEKSGALHFFGDKYGEVVSVYFVGETLESAYSKEFCGGPHVTNTSELGAFKILKEEAVSAGVRRIKAVLS